jgi:hypothetical protein
MTPSLDMQEDVPDFSSKHDSDDETDAKASITKQEAAPSEATTVETIEEE